MPSEYAHALRSSELDLAIPLLPAGGKILELGAGDGWQASLLAQLGFVVSAIDVAGSAKGHAKHFPVIEYDGATLPFPANSFDAIYSSNVLEHVLEFHKIQSELARVLKPSGIAVHCVPSASWRLWTTLGYPIYAARWGVNYIRRKQFGEDASSVEHQSSQLNNKSLLRLLRMAALPTRHGEHGNVLSEHYLFSERCWRRRFSQTGWAVESTRPTGMFYSGNEILGLRLSIHSRMHISKLLGSSTLIFVLRPVADSYQGL